MEAGGDQDVRTEIDLQLKVMSRVTEALKELKPASARQVLRWAGEAYGIQIDGNGGFRGGARTPEGSNGNVVERLGGVKPRFECEADLYAAAKPQTDEQKALVIGYWLQEIKGESDWPSQTLNNILKQLGHGVSNITKSLTMLKERKPSLAMQIQKSGTSQQARKKYKLTHEGVLVVKRMLEGMPLDSNEE